MGFVTLLAGERLAPAKVALRKLTQGNTELTIPRTAGASTTGIVYLRNDSPTSTAVFRLSTKRVPDLSSFDKIRDELLRRTTGGTTLTLARAAYDLVSQYRRYNWMSAKPTEEVFDPVKLFNVYGYGLCDAAARALATILYGLDIRAAVWDLHVHVITEFFDGKTSQTLDPDMRVHAYVRGTTRTVPAKMILANRRRMAPAEVSDSGQAKAIRNQLVRALDRVTTPPRPATWKPVSTHDAGIRLRPGESMIRYSHSNLGYFATLDSTPPPLYANAVFEWERELPPATPTEDDIDDAHIRTRLPFVIIGGIIELTGIDPGTPLPVPLVSAEGEDFLPCELLASADDPDGFRMTYALPPSVYGSYGVTVWLHHEDSLGDGELPRMKYRQTIVTQCSPTTFPAVDATTDDDQLKIEVSGPSAYEISVVYETSNELVNDFAVLVDPDDEDQL